MHNAIGYHTYAGGLAVGVARHFNLAGLGEHDGYGNAIKALNFPGVPLWDRYDQWPKTRGKGAKAVPFIFSNPPCAIFSLASAGRSTTWQEDPRLQLWKDIVRLIPEVQPDILAIESVVPAWIKGRQLIDGLAATAAGWGYSTTILLHNAKWLGAVQDRKRVFFIFHNIQAEWPEPNFDNYVTVRDAIGKVKVPVAEKRRYEREAMLSALAPRSPCGEPAPRTSSSPRCARASRRTPEPRAKPARSSSPAPARAAARDRTTRRPS